MDIHEFLDKNPLIYNELDLSYSEVWPVVAYIKPIYTYHIANYLSEKSIYDGKIVASNDLKMYPEFYKDFEVFYRVNTRVIYKGLKDNDCWVMLSEYREDLRKHPIHYDVKVKVSSVDVLHSRNPNFDIKEFKKKYIKPQEYLDASVNTISRLEQHPTGQLVLTPMEIKMYDIDLSIHYTEGFVNESEQIIEKLKDDKSGVFLFNGKPGTGKTSYIEYLTKFVQKTFVWVPVSLFETLFTDPSKTEFIHENLKDTVLVIEDAENILVDKGDRSSATSTLLNMTSGTIAKSLNLKVIMTFNTETKNLDKALMRPGRLRHQYEFQALTFFEACGVMEYIGKSEDCLESIDKEYTLAELYNLDEIKKDDTPRTIGFGKR